jgi:hypothetical protein
MALLAISSAMLLLTCLWQMGITVVIAELSHAPRLRDWCSKHLTRRSLAMLTGVGLTALGLVGDILLWAVLLRALKLFTNLHDSFYFSAMTFTSVGYGDVVLPECWHLLSVGLAVNGLLMAGWSTALLVNVVQHITELRTNGQADQACSPSRRLQGWQEELRHKSRGRTLEGSQIIRVN